jgi:hypothetical protein
MLEHQVEELIMFHFITKIECDHTYKVLFFKSCFVVNLMTELIS